MSATTEILLIAFVAAVLWGAQHCSEMAEFGRAEIKLLKRFLKLKHGIPSHAGTHPVKAALCEFDR